MKAAVFDAFRSPLAIREVADLEPRDDAVVLDVRACGVCRSDWHAWMGHDEGVSLPHVPGHELAGTVARVGGAVRRWSVGQRVTAPFCCGCGVCHDCRCGAPQVCSAQTQPGFTHWGAFAEQVEVRHADFNLVALPEAVDFVTAASLGCRFTTSFRAVVQQGRVSSGQWVVVHGCGGVGLSAVMIARSLGAMVIAVDIRTEPLRWAKRLGAVETIDASTDDVVSRVVEITGRGAEVSIDALGSRQTCYDSVRSLAPRGRHVQVGLLLGQHVDPPLPLGEVVAKELEVIGSHGMSTTGFAPVLRSVTAGLLDPRQLIGDVVSLEQGAAQLARMDCFAHLGVSVIELP